MRARPSAIVTAKLADPVEPAVGETDADLASARFTLLAAGELPSRRSGAKGREGCRDGRPPRNP